MFYIVRTDDETVTLSGRFDASHESKAVAILDAVQQSAVLDFTKLSYIASAGMGLLFAAQKRLTEEGHTLRIVNMSRRVREVFEIAGFLQFFEVE